MKKGILIIAGIIVFFTSTFSAKAYSNMSVKEFMMSLNRLLIITIMEKMREVYLLKYIHQNIKIIYGN